MSATAVRVVVDATAQAEVMAMKANERRWRGRRQHGRSGGDGGGKGRL